jgi:hypothetical protein
MDDTMKSDILVVDTGEYIGCQGDRTMEEVQRFVADQEAHVLGPELRLLTGAEIRALRAAGGFYARHMDTWLEDSWLVTLAPAGELPAEPTLGG